MISKKRGQMKLSFGMIFSIILIIAFIAFAVWGVMKLLNTQDDIKKEKFYSDLQNDVDEVWGSTYGNQTPEPYALPREVDLVCFVDNEDKENLKLLKKGEEFDSTIKKGHIENIDLENSLEQEDGEGRKCIINKNGEIRLTLIKKEGNPKVIIKESNQQ